MTNMSSHHEHTNLAALSEDVAALRRGDVRDDCRARLDGVALLLVVDVGDGQDLREGEGVRLARAAGCADEAGALKTWHRAGGRDWVGCTGGVGGARSAGGSSLRAAGCRRRGCWWSCRRSGSSWW
jgi:hypothetical protein